MLELFLLLFLCCLELFYLLEFPSIVTNISLSKILDYLFLEETDLSFVNFELEDTSLLYFIERLTNIYLFFLFRICGRILFYSLSTLTLVLFFSREFLDKDIKDFLFLFLFEVLLEYIIG